MWHYVLCVCLFIFVLCTRSASVVHFCVNYANLFLIGGCWFCVVFLYFSNDFRWFGITIFRFARFLWAGFLCFWRFNRRFGVAFIFRFTFHAGWLLTWDFRIFSCIFFFIMLWLNFFRQRRWIACWLFIQIILWFWLFRCGSGIFVFRFTFFGFGGWFWFFRCFTRFIVLKFIIIWWLVYGIVIQIIISSREKKKQHIITNWTFIWKGMIQLAFHWLTLWGGESINRHTNTCDLWFWLFYYLAKCAVETVCKYFLADESK